MNDTKIPDETTNEKPFDFNAVYTVHGYGGIAWHAYRYAQREIPESWTFDCIDPEAHIYDDDHSSACYIYNEPEMVDDTDQVVCIMVGDDREFVFDIDDLTEINEDDYCPGCGAVPSCYGPND